jgi:hypothetical protein
MSPIRPPSRGEMLASAAITLGACLLVGVSATLLVGSVGVFVDIALTDKTAAASTPTGLPVAAVDVLVTLVLATVWTAACRLGLGSPGDGVMDLKAFSIDGRPARRRQHWVRAGLPLGAFGVLGLLGLPAAGAALVTLAWAVCLVRSDRRSAVDLLIGVVPHTTTVPRTAVPFRPTARPR